jgi:hypothetical protein
MMRKLIYPTRDTRAHVVEGVFATVAFIEYRDRAGTKTSAWREQDLGMHSRKRPRYWRGRTALPNCQFLNGDACWYDGSFGGAITAKSILTKQGSDALFDDLELWYTNRFGKEVTR